MSGSRPVEKENTSPRQYTRREVLLRAGAAGAVAVGAVGLGTALSTQDPRSKMAERGRIRDHRVERADSAPRMAVVRGQDAALNVRAAIEAMGGMASFVRKGEVVVIKPNVGWNRLPEQGANTTPEVVAEVVRLVRDAGAARVLVTDVPVNEAGRCFKRSGILDAVHAVGGEVVFPDDRAFREVAVGGVTLRAADVLWPLVEADRVINLPVVKQHGLSGATLAMKNWYGVIGGHRVRLHQDIHNSIVDLAQMVMPTLTVMDATRVLTANGPSGGSLDDVRYENAIAVSCDEVALDAWGAGVLGLDPAQLAFVVEAARRGLGTEDWRSLQPIEKTLGA
ncbi:MAG: DUF362 domain-containing protein [Pseudomonadota bacterium]